MRRMEYEEEYEVRIGEDGKEGENKKEGRWEGSTG